MAGVSDAALKEMTQEERVTALGMRTEQLTGKSMYMEFDPEATERFTYPWAMKVMARLLLRTHVACTRWVLASCPSST